MYRCNTVNIVRKKVMHAYMFQYKCCNSTGSQCLFCNTLCNATLCADVVCTVSQTVTLYDTISVVIENRCRTIMFHNSSKTCSLRWHKVFKSVKTSVWRCGLSGGVGIWWSFISRWFESHYGTCVSIFRIRPSKPRSRVAEGVTHKRSLTAKSHRC
jgi:hypothetical protein